MKGQSSYSPLAQKNRKVMSGRVDMEDDVEPTITEYHPTRQIQTLDATELYPIIEEDPHEIMK